MDFGFGDMSIESIYKEIESEREYQRDKWGLEADDTLNTPSDFMGYISHYGTKWFPGGFRPYKRAVVDSYRKHMIKVAAIAVAAIESLDRQRERNGAAHFEKNDTHELEGRLP